MWPMGGQTLDIPRRQGGLAAYFVGETEEATDSEGDWDSVALTARKLAVLTRISSELMEDSVIDLASFLSEEIARSFAEKEDDCLFNGDGTSTYGGIVGLRYRLANDGTAGLHNAALNHDSFIEITAGDLRGLMAKLPKYARRGAKWYVSSTAKELVFGRLMTEAGGNNAADMAAMNAQSFAGYPIVETVHMPSDEGSLSGEIMLMFGNMRQSVAFGDRRRSVV